MGHKKESNNVDNAIPRSLIAKIAVDLFNAEARAAALVAAWRKLARSHGLEKDPESNLVRLGLVNMSGELRAVCDALQDAVSPPTSDEEDGGSVDSQLEPTREDVDETNNESRVTDTDEKPGIVKSLIRRLFSPHNK